MLTGKKAYKHVVLIGSTSDIGIAILAEIPYAPNAEILLVGRVNPGQLKLIKKQVSVKFYECDLGNLDELERLASKLRELIDIDIAIVAAGYLSPENRELDLYEVNKSMMINSVAIVYVLSALANRMIKQSSGSILHISTVAALRPRMRNFTYGSSKSSADFFASGLSNKYRKSGLKISILRPGYVFTKMSKNFSPAPFAIDKKYVAKSAVRGIIKSKKIIYAPWFLQIIFYFLRHLPSFLFSRIDQKA
jgi:decaprenylphospho-beta-D-erythro-pentofuranosid-2-ulose 2-reductase